MRKYRQLTDSVISASTVSLLRAALKSFSTRVAAVVVLTIAMPVAHASTKVAFIADQGAGSASAQVLSMIAEEGVDLVLIQGDLGYKQDTANLWESHLDDELGKNFPVLSVVGNHENYQWPLYQRLIEQRIDRANGLSCSGEVGVKARCQFGNLDIVQVAPGITEVAGVNPIDDYAGFIRSSFEGSTLPWRICSWHKNQTQMQIYKKGDAVGWDVFDACLDTGAMVAMGHAHTYSRTFEMSDFRKQTVAHTDDALTLAPGRSFAVVSGLGGRDIKPQLRGGDQFASVYSATQGATHGALFCDFGNTEAQCYFKSIDGAVPDRFTISNEGTSKGTDAIGVPEPAISPTAALPANDQGGDGYVFSRTDKTEYRWIQRTGSGAMGNIWIEESCAAKLGGARIRGSWKDLDRLAPEFDAVANPCDGATTGTIDTSRAPDTTDPADSATGGFVFERTDKDEYRWIARNSLGQMGNVWVDAVCAARLGGTKQRGRWSQLLRVAPALDTIAYPC